MGSEWTRRKVHELQASGSLLVEDGNHGEYRPRPDEFTNNGASFIRAADMADGRVLFKSAECINDIARARVRKGIGKPGDVLLSHKGTVGKVALVEASCPDFVCSPQTTFWRVLNDSVIDRSYLFAYLQSHDFKVQLASRKGETDMADYVSLTAQRQLTIPLPHIEVQRAIGKYSSILADRINLLRETNATLEAIAQALFKSWFVDFDPVRAKMEGRAPEGMDEATAALFTDGFEESELGLVPRGWAVSSLGGVCSYLNRGISPKYLEEDGVLVLNQKCIRDFSIDYNKGRRHDPVQRKIDGRAITVGDVLVNSTGVGTLGRVAQVLELPEQIVIVDSHVTVVRAGATLSWPYLGQLMARRQPEIEAMGEGSTGQTELSRSKLAEIRVLVPPTDLLECFDQIVIPLKKRVALNEAKTRTLARLRDTLLPRLISGQLRLPEAEALIA
ncbi:restriction endonuclease subunit S [Chromobacterium violaceum]|uniref:restriction endonuclease subunit S n=1 Tax=Chromobacterium violaceum TaxID=536 RepID=UPI001C8BF163|nr:restriction endonuclease subunit S [Chromobacterium violaceum]MBX9266540.1 restriction endonuclease subunit S [Chromobacterium violaceum]